jgi:hypothetical protein
MDGGVGVTRSTFAWTGGLSADTLRHLASIAERAERREFVDPERAATEIAQMLTNGTRPTIGWYRRNYVPLPEALDPPVPG